MDPIRTCIACRRRRPQHELVRIVATPEGVAVDPSRRPAGRGAYVCPDVRCVEAAARGGARTLRRALRTGDESEAERALAMVPTDRERADLPEERRA